MDQLIGHSLEQYEIESLLGEGGMGVVYKARDLTLQRVVAVKVMHAQFARVPEFQERFLQEARAVARLDHPGIVKVFGFGKVDSLLYIAMEFIPGSNLRTLLLDPRAAGKGIVLSEAVQLVRQVCFAVDYAHRHGVLHRDLKPDNIMLKEDDSNESFPFRPVLTDLGLAKLQEGGLQTETGASMGTPAYMSPEQARGEKIDKQSDVYSLGVLLYELAVGQLPFKVRTITEASRVDAGEKPLAPHSLRPDLPESLERVILKALARDPANRYADAKSFAVDLADSLSPGLAKAALATETEAATSIVKLYDQIRVEEHWRSIWALFPELPTNLDQAQLRILMPDHTNRLAPMKVAGLSIGRRADNDVVLDQPEVSGRHARVEFDGANFRVKDLGSSTGTYLSDIKLLPGILELWPSGQLLRIGEFWLRLELARLSVPPPPPPSSPPTPVAAVVIEPKVLSVVPGDSKSATVKIINQSLIVDHFALSVTGVAAKWVTIVPAEVKLIPGGDESVTVTWAPPHTPQSSAGNYEAVIRVSSTVPPYQVAEAKLGLKIEPFAQISSDLRPPKIKARVPAEVWVDNLGNIPQTVTIDWRDRGDELMFDPPQRQVVVPNGEKVRVGYKADLKKPPLVRRREQVYYFSAHVNAPGVSAAPPQQLDGEMVSPPVFPYWLLLPLLAICLCVPVAILCGNLAGFWPWPIPKPTPTVQVTTFPVPTVTPIVPITVQPVPNPICTLATLENPPRKCTVYLGWSLGVLVGTSNPWAAGNSTQQGQQFMFEPLAYYGIFANKEIPWLADSMTYNADFTQLTIKLNPNATWSDGTALTSDDVAFTFNGQLTNNKLSYSSYFTQYVKDWTTPDPQTVILNFKIPAPRFAYDVLTYKFDTGIPIVPKAAYAGQSDVVAFPGGNNMIHSGPYNIVAWDKNQKILDLRPDWWAIKAGKHAMPAVQRIVMVNIGGLVDQNMDIIAQRIDNNEFDVMLDVRAPVISSILKANPKVTSWTGNDSPYGYVDWWPNSLWMNTQLAPYSDPNIRRAICDTVDRTKINESLYDGAKIATIYPFPLYPALQAFANSDAMKAQFIANASNAMQTMKADLDESAKLMTAAGYAKNSDGLWAKDGNTVNATIQTLGSIHTDIAPLLVEMLKAGGFDASANFGNDGYSNMAAGKPGLYMFGHGASTVDPFAVLSLYDTKYSAPVGTTTGNNAFSRYSNPDYDKLIETMAPLSADDPKFQDAAAQAMGIYWRDTLDCPIIQWLHRIPYNQTYWTNWPLASNLADGENGAFWAGTGMLVITGLKPVQ